MRSTRRSFLQKSSTLAAAALLAHRTPAQADQTADLAHDPLRPACHLLPPHNWMNDPNGPLFWKGKYHLFYQLNPNSAVWGDMHWGHASSTDMVHWHHQPIALAPTPGGADSEGCFSGSAVVYNGVPTIIYTGVQNAPPAEVTLRDGNDKLRETQMLAIADGDALLHWKKLEQPIIATPPPGMNVTGFRDPCPWREDDGWYLAVGSGQRGKGGCVLLYRSHDLRHWDYLHPLVWGKPNGKAAANPCDSGEMWECPDFFPLSLPGSTETRHVLIYSTENKVLWTTGRYDRPTHKYTPEKQGLLDQGPSYYAPKSFAAPDRRRVLWGWLRETRPEAHYAAAGWAGCMSYPRVLSLSADGALQMTPAREVETLRGTPRRSQVTPDTPYRFTLDTLQREWMVTPAADTGTVRLRVMTGDQCHWDLSVGWPGKTMAMSSPPVPIRLLLDASVAEVFMPAGHVFTNRIYDLAPAASYIEISSPSSMEVETWALKPISPNRLTT